MQLSVIGTRQIRAVPHSGSATQTGQTRRPERLGHRRTGDDARMQAGGTVGRGHLSVSGFPVGLVDEQDRVRAPCLDEVGDALDGRTRCLHAARILRGGDAHQPDPRRQRSDDPLHVQRVALVEGHPDLAHAHARADQAVATRREAWRHEDGLVPGPAELEGDQEQPEGGALGRDDVIDRHLAAARDLLAEFDRACRRAVAESQITQALGARQIQQLAERQVL